MIPLVWVITFSNGKSSQKYNRKYKLKYKRFFCLKSSTERDTTIEEGILRKLNILVDQEQP